MPERSVAAAGVAEVPVPATWRGVDPRWMTRALGVRFPGAVVDALHVDGLEFGTNSRSRVRLSYASGFGPSSVFVKGPGRWGNRLALLALGAHFTEARLVRSAADLPLNHPDFFAAGVDPVRLGAVVVMEDVVVRGGVPKNATKALSVDEVASGLRGLARLHARYAGRPLAPELGFLRPWRLSRGWALVSVAGLARGLRRLDELGWPGGRPRGLHARALGAEFRGSSILAASGLQTVLHGDPHPGNAYRLEDGGLGFFDWQLARRGHWSHDVGYFLVASLSVADRRREERGLLDEYLRSRPAPGHRAPATDAEEREEAWARYRAMPAFGLASWVHTLSFGTFQRRDVCLATIERFAAAYDDLETRRSVLAGIC